jgi:luciferase family oxidoreductase group 1
LFIKLKENNIDNMTIKLSDIPVSVLDLANIIEGDASAGAAFERSKILAQHAEKLGYKRYWFAEHHNMESVASAATSVLIGYIANATSTIRVGSGGIMLPNHAPLIIAEQFGTLASLFPGRIDLGIGRAPGTDSVTSFALRRSLKGDINQFPNDVVELINYLGPKDPIAEVRAIPGEGTQVPVWLLGSSVYSAQLAGVLGLPFAFASHFAPRYLMEAINVYRSNFKPSQFLQEPYLIACVNIIAADSDKEAEHLATSFYQIVLGMFRNKRRPLQPPIPSMEGIWAEHEKSAVQQMMEYSFIGSAETIAQSLQQFLDNTGVNEIMMASHIYDIKAKMRSFELIAGVFKGDGTI